jgi:signal transduction histidine kinase
MDEITTKQLSLFESILAMLKTDQLSTQKELFEVIPLNQLIETCSKNLSKEVSEKKLNLIISLTEEIHVFAHPTLFYQAIHNLLSNAIKFTPVGNTIRIVIWDDQTHVKIAIKDEGIGFEPGKAERLFDRFTQESRLGTNNERSTGLGLYLVRKIIQNHNGYVNAESEGVGKGAVFTVAIKKLI